MRDEERFRWPYPVWTCHIQEYEKTEPLMDALQRPVSGDVFLLPSISPTPSQRKGKRLGEVSKNRAPWGGESDRHSSSLRSKRPDDRDKAKPDLETGTGISHRPTDFAAGLANDFS